MRPPSASQSSTIGRPDPLGGVDQPALLAHADRRRGAGHDARVDADDRDLTTVELAVAGDHGVAGNRLGPPQLGLGQQADLEPRVGIDQPLEPLADGQPPGCVVLGNAVGSAHRQRLVPALLQVGQQLFDRCTSQDHPLVLTIRIVN